MPSAVVSAINYNASTSTLEITFVSGMVYHYKDVPRKVYHALKTSGSKGTYLNQHIKSRFQFEKIR